MIPKRFGRAAAGRVLLLCIIGALVLFLTGIQSNAVAQAQIKVACIGNSITSGGTPSYPSLLQSLLGAQYLVENDGVGGKTIIKNDYLSYWQGGKLPQVFALQPHIVTIELGTNDTKYPNWSTRRAELKTDYLAMVDTLNTLLTRPRIFLVLPPPIFPNTIGLYNAPLLEIIVIIKEIAQARNLPLIDVNTPFLASSVWFADGVHPNAQGIDSMARIFYRAIINDRIDTTVVAAPSISPQGGSFGDSVRITLTCATSGATIRYTLNRSVPVATSDQYTAPFWLKSSATLKVKGFKTGKTESSLDSAVFVIVTQSPYSGTPYMVPGKIEAEAFDNGGELLAYHDATPANQGNASFRTTDGVDIETMTGGGRNIGYVSAGEWLEYTVDVVNTGNYDIDCGVASAGDNGSFHIEFNDVNKTGAITVPNTGSWGTYQAVTKINVLLSAGRQVMRVVFDAVGSKDNGVANIDYVNIKLPATIISPFSTGNRTGALINVGPHPLRNRVTFTLPENAGANARVEIYGWDGRVVYTVGAIGRLPLQWDGTDMSGHPVNSGVYFYTVTTGNRRESNRIIVLPHDEAGR